MSASLAATPFHPIESRRLFSGTRTACTALRAPKLPAHYPLAMFVAKCHGTMNWFTSVRPPSYGAMRVLDAMAASALRATAGWALSASAHFLREIPEGGVGVPRLQSSGSPTSSVSTSDT